MRHAISPFVQSNGSRTGVRQVKVSGRPPARFTDRRPARTHSVRLEPSGSEAMRPFFRGSRGLSRASTTPESAQQSGERDPSDQGSHPGNARRLESMRRPPHSSPAGASWPACPLGPALPLLPNVAAWPLSIPERPRERESNARPIPDGSDALTLPPHLRPTKLFDCSQRRVSRSISPA